MCGINNQPSTGVALFSQIPPQNQPKRLGSTHIPTFSEMYLVTFFLLPFFFVGGGGDDKVCFVLLLFRLFLLLLSGCLYFTFNFSVHSAIVKYFCLLNQWVGSNVVCKYTLSVSFFFFFTLCINFQCIFGFSLLSSVQCRCFTSTETIRAIRDDCLDFCTTPELPFCLVQ